MTSKNYSNKTRPAEKENCNWKFLVTSSILIMALVGCGGGGGSVNNTVAKTPMVTNITPQQGIVNIQLLLNVTGTDIPSTIDLTMTDASCNKPTNVQSTGFNIICTPDKTGVKIVTIRTATALNNGKIIDNSHSVNITTAPPSISLITPNAAELNVPTKFSVIGVNIPSTVEMNMEDGSCGTATGISTNGFFVVCTPKKIGTKIVTIKTDTAEIGGIVFDSSRTVVVSNNVPVEPIVYPFGVLKISGHLNTNEFKPCFLNNTQNSLFVYSCNNSETQQNFMSFSFANDAQGKVTFQVNNGSNFTFYNNFYGKQYPVNNRENRKIVFDNVTLYLAGSGGSQSKLPADIIVNGTLSY